MIDPYEPKLGLAPVRSTSRSSSSATTTDPLQPADLAGDPHLVPRRRVRNQGGRHDRNGRPYHDAKKGASGKEFIYTVEIDDLRICHLGTSAHGLSEDQLEGIGRRSTCSSCQSAAAATSTPRRGRDRQPDRAEAGRSRFRTNCRVDAAGAEPRGRGKVRQGDGCNRPDAAAKLQISASPVVDETKLLILEPRGATASAAVD